MVAKAWNFIKTISLYTLHDYNVSWFYLNAVKTIVYELKFQER